MTMDELINNLEELNSNNRVYNVKLHSFINENDLIQEYADILEDELRASILIVKSREKRLEYLKKNKDIFQP